MVVVDDPTASNGQYVYSSVSHLGYVELGFFVAVESNYHLWGRASADSDGSNSFWVAVDGGAEALWDIPIGPWAWQVVTHRVNDELSVVQTYHLAPGWHQVRVLAREGGARLDVVDLSCAGGAPAPTATPTHTLTPTPTATPVLLYDLDGDCDVDIVDVMLVAGRWGSRVGDAVYDPRYDLDDDGDIDIVDIMRVASHWGESCGGSGS